MKVTTEELAHAMYANSVHHDSWAQEQQSLKFRWFEEAERLIANMAKADFEIVKYDKPSVTPEPVVPVAKVAQVPGNTPEAEDEKLVKKHK